MAVFKRKVCANSFPIPRAQMVRIGRCCRASLQRNLENAAPGQWVVSRAAAGPLRKLDVCSLQVGVCRWGTTDQPSAGGRGGDTEDLGVHLYSKFTASKGMGLLSRTNT